MYVCNICCVIDSQWVAALEDKIRIPARPCNILYLHTNVGFRQKRDMIHRWTESSMIYLEKRGMSANSKGWIGWYKGKTRLLSLHGLH